MELEVIAYDKETDAVFKDGELVFNNSPYEDRKVIHIYEHGPLVVDSVEEYLSFDRYKDNDVTKWIKEID